MFTAALFIMAKTWNQPNVLQWINELNKLCYIHSMEYYSVLKRNELPREEEI